MWNGSRFHTARTIKKLYNVEIGWLDYQSLIAAIPGHWKFFLPRDNLIDTHVYKYELIQDKLKVSQIIYRDMIDNQKSLFKCAKIWSEKIWYHRHAGGLLQTFPEPVSPH